MLTPTLRQRLAAVDPASLCDAGPTLRVLPPELRPVAPGGQLVGRAVTAAADDLMSVLAGLDLAGPGDVLVVAAGGADHAVAGELFATEALRRGLAGMVVDGYCRDRSTLVELALPIYCRGFTPRAAGVRSVPRIQVSVHIGGTTVHPGDLLVGDDDGIVVGTEAEFTAAVSGAEAIRGREEGLRAAIGTGVALLDRTNFAEHRAWVEAGEASTFRFLD